MLLHTILLILLTMNSSFAENKSCNYICHNSSNCVNECYDQTIRQLKDTIQTPHCGLTRTVSAVRGRIVGGEDAETDELPWVVSLMDKRSNNFCGGVIINSRYILTAAHCILPEYLDHIMYGSVNISENNGIIVRTESTETMNKTMFKHREHYMDGTHVRNDFALIKTSKPIEFIKQNDKYIVNNICLPVIDSEPEGWAVAAGWGLDKRSVKSYPKILQRKDVLIISREKCSNIWKETGGKNTKQVINDKMICTMLSVPPGYLRPDDYKGPNGGDSGSSLIQYINGRAYSIGIVSFQVQQIALQTSKNARNNPTVVYTQVSKYTKWIKDTIDNQ